MTLATRGRYCDRWGETRFEFPIRRIGSAIALDVDDLDIESGELRLRTTKGDRPQTIFLGRQIRDHFARYIGDRATGPLFLGRHARRITTRQAQRRFRHSCDRAGIRDDASCHSLRHRLASRLYRQSRDILLVQRALGHRSIASTVVYAQVNQLQLRRALEG